MLVTKADGNLEEFKPEKLRSSLRRAGASGNEIERIVTELESSLIEGITTGEIYGKAFELLRESGETTAAKYSLRRGLFGLGPTGFPFEDFLARLFAAEGYRTKTRLLIKGKCATHEIDVAAYSKDHSFVAEAKFHMRPGLKSDLQVALYSYARYLDLKAHPVCEEDDCGINDLIVATNTKFTHAAITYAQCQELKLLSWGYPKGNSLQDRIERAGLYPITVLSSLSSKEKQQLLASGIILCRELVKNPDSMAQNGVSRRKTQAVIDEARQLCGG